MKRNAPAVLVETITDESNPPGAFKYTGLHGFDGGPYGMNFLCPCGCGAMHGASFDNVPPEALTRFKQGGWHWNGDRERPTITPSLGCYPTHHDQSVGKDGYHWHGYLKNGVFEEC